LYEAKPGALFGNPADAHHIMVFQYFHKTDPLLERQTDPLIQGFQFSTLRYKPRKY
jgi:hypothetical protein